MSSLVENLLENALFLAGNVEKASARSLNFLEAAEVFLEAGMQERCQETLGEAQKITESIKLPAERVLRMAWEAGLYARCGNVKQAKELFQRSILLARATPEMEKIQALVDVVGEYIDLDFEQDGLAVLAELEGLVAALGSGAEKTHQLALVADLYAEFGESDKARATLETAVEIARSIPDKWFRAERLVEIAESYGQLADKEKTAATLEIALETSGRIEQANRPYFLLNIVDILLDLDRRNEALQLLKEMLEIATRDQSSFSRAGALIELAERYRDAGSEKMALDLLSVARETGEKAENDNDRISGFTRIADLLGQMGQLQKALDLAEKAFFLCGNLKNERTHIYMLGDIALVCLRLKARDKTARCISRIIELVDQSEVRTLGLGEVATELAEGGEIVLALRLAGKIREGEVKASALCAIASSIVAENAEPTEEMELAVREIGGGASAERGLF